VNVIQAVMYPSVERTKFLDKEYNHHLPLTVVQRSVRALDLLFLTGAGGFLFAWDL
jgi:hypothetical protein